jgi:hypothetical protein
MLKMLQKCGVDSARRRELGSQDDSSKHGDADPGIEIHRRSVLRFKNDQDLGIAE